MRICVSCVRHLLAMFSYGVSINYVCFMHKTPFTYGVSNNYVYFMYMTPLAMECPLTMCVSCTGSPFSYVLLMSQKF